MRDAKVSSGVNSPRFLVQVASADEVPRRRFYLEVGCHRVGSTEGVEIHLPVSGVSRLHAEIEVLSDGGAVLTDLGSRNGTWVGSRRVRKTVLGGGEQLAFGSLVAQLASLDGRDAEIAISPRDSGPQGAVMPPSGSLERPPLSTLGSALEDRLVESLVRAARARCHHGGAPLDIALQLATEWLDAMLLDRVEICTGEVLLAAVGETETAVTPFEIEEHGIKFRLWGADGRRLERLGPLLQIARALISGAADRGEPAKEEKELAGDATSGDLPGAGSLDAKLIRLCRRAAKIARGDVAVLLRGESGVGKEVIARWIHRRSPRRDAPFVALNCAALPKELLEAELFGIERGVATGVERRRGLLEEASGGTLFLDEIGDMAAETQAKFLRVLESRSFYRVGGRSPVEVDVRYMAATHRDLVEGIETGTFRRDLFHRLAAFAADIPPLRARRSDIALLAAHFLNRELRQTSTRSPGMTRAALGALLAYEWPGNVRELENEIRRGVLLLEPAEPLGLRHLSGPIRRNAGEDAAQALRLDAALRRAEREAYAAALAASGGDALEAMKSLGVSRATFYRKLKELDLSPRR